MGTAQGRSLSLRSNILKFEAVDPDAAFQAHLKEMFNTPMPFGASDLWDVHCLRIGAYSYIALSFHHIIVDTVAVHLALAQLLQAYLGLSAGQLSVDLPQSAVRPLLDSDLAYNSSEQFDRDLDHWKARYETRPPRLINAPKSNTDDPFATIVFRDIPNDSGFAEAAEAAKLLPHRALFGLLAVTLARRFGQSDFAIGLALHRRDRHSMQTVAMLAGLIPVRATFEDWWSLEDCVAAFDEGMDEDLRHNRLPLDALYREIGATGAGETGLFDVTMSFVPGAASFDLPNGSSSGLAQAREASPISFHATSDPKSGAFSYRLAVNPEYRDCVDAEALADLFDAAIRQFAEGDWIDFNDVEAISEKEKERLSSLSSPVSLGCCDLVPSRILGHVLSRRDAPAVAEGSGPALSYGDLWSRSRGRARGLASCDVGPGDRVGVFVDLNAHDHGVDLIVTLLAIWQRGAAFVPLNSEDPADRLCALASDAGVCVVIAPEAHGSSAGALGRVYVFDSAATVALEAASAADDAAADGAVLWSGDQTAYIYYTSGTTGLPKPVVISHDALAAFTLAIGAPLGTGPETRVLSAASPLFDALFMDIAASLAQGGLLIRLTARGLGAPGYLASAAEAHCATYLDLTPTVWRAALGTGWIPGAGFTAVTGGEAIDVELAGRLTSQGARLFNSYGPTEATVVTIAGEITGDDIAAGVLPIGAPLAGTQALVLDPFGGLCAPGVPGELCLAGAQLSAGYAGRPGQTAQAFTAHPERAGARLYRTGDLVAWRGDGRLTYLGRIDSQIKIRGMRVELDEISTALGALPGVGSAVALMQDKTLVALFTRAGAAAEAEGGSGPALVDLSVADHDALTAGLAARLPAHMIPAAVAEVTYLPVTASGKIDLRALPEVTAQQVPFAAPEGEIERAIAGEIAALIAQETGTPPPAISRHDSFFGLGGHSLMAVRLTARLAQATGTQIPLRSLFEAGTIKDIAVAIAAQAKTAALPPLRKAADDAPIPLSYAQERLWFVERFAAPGTIAEVLGFDLEGVLDAPRLRASFAALYGRHDALRMRVHVEDGVPVQRFGAAEDLPYETHDLRGQDAATQEAWITARRSLPVDPARSAFRIDLVQTGDAAHTLIIAMHHMVYDGVSLAVLIGELGALWAADGGPVALPAREISYGDYAAWQRRSLTSGPLHEALERVARRLADPPAPVALPSDRPRPAHPTHAAARLPLVLPPELSQALRATAQAEGASLFMLLETALAVLVAREARSSDIIIGTVASGRTQAETLEAIGPFFNMLALRHDIRLEAPFTQTLAQARDTALAAFDDQLVPFEAVLERTLTHRDARTAVSPLFSILFQLHTEAGQLLRPLSLGGLAAQPRDWSKPLAMQDLTFDLFETETGIEGQVTYATELFDAARIEALLARYVTLLSSIAADPAQACAQLNLLPERQAAAVLSLSSPVSLGCCDLVPSRILGHVLSRRDAPAVAEGSGPALSYGDLWSRSRGRARGLASCDVGPGDRVGVFVDLNAHDHGVDLIVTLLAIWQRGAAFVPLNSEDPADRLCALASDAGVCVVIAPEAHGSSAGALGRVYVFDSAATVALEAASAADDAAADGAVLWSGDQTAYIYYTSGTTGLPKPVVISHDALAAFTLAIGAPLGTGPETRVLSAASPLFDALFMDIAASLAQGGLLIRLTARGLGAPGYLASAAEAHCATYLDLTPTVWRAALGTGWIPGAGFTAVTGGEAIDVELAGRLTSQGARLFNSYGPTEATVVTIAGEITGDDIAAGVLPIGAPLAGHAGACS